MEGIKLIDIFVGKTDGAIEARQENFKELFFDPHNKYDELMRNKEKFLVVGSKGSGKTYLANYIKLMASEKENVKIVDASELLMVKLNAINTDNLDEELSIALCKWFLLYELAKEILNKYKIRAKYGICSKVYKLKKFINEFENEDFFKNITRSSGKSDEKAVNSGIGAKHDKISFDRKESKKNIKSVSYEAERKKFYELIPVFENKVFSTMKKKDSFIIIIDDLDEMECDCSNGNRGINIISMIRVAKEYNLKNTESNFKYILLLRDDILSDLQCRNANLSKIKTSCAVELYWLYDSVCEQWKHPLISMIFGKIRACCDAYKEYDNKKLFTILFPENIDNKKPLDFLLDNTLGRPRDITNFLSHAQRLFPEEKCFTAKILKEARKPYASDLYDEILNQTAYLERTKYVQQCLNLISTFKKSSFSYEEIKHIYEEHKDLFYEIDSLETALSFLYRLGVIGNTWRVNNKQHSSWSYKKDAMNDVDLSKRFTIHYGIRKKFSF